MLYLHNLLQSVKFLVFLMTRAPLSCRFLALLCTMFVNPEEEISPSGQARSQMETQAHTLTQTHTDTHTPVHEDFLILSSLLMQEIILIDIRHCSHCVKHWFRVLFATFEYVFTCEVFHNIELSLHDYN